MPIFPTGYTNGTPTSDDRLLFSDTSASNQTKDCALSELPISTATQTALDGKIDNVIAGTNTTVSRNGNVITVNSLGGPAVVTDGFNRNYLVATEGQTEFTATFDFTENTGSVIVTLNGNVLKPTLDYTEPGLNKVVFVSGLTAGDEVQLITGIKGDKGDKGDTGTGAGDMLKSENLSGLADNETARDNLEVSKRFTTSHITASVNPAVPYTTYLVNASAGNVTITLPNATNTNDEYRIVLEENTHYITVTTVGGTQLIGGKASQIISTVGGGLYIKSSTDHYDIISDTRQLERIVDVTTDTDLSISGYENGTTYHIIPSGGTITVTLPDSSSIIEGTNVRFTLHGTGSCIIKTDGLELIEGLQEQVININGAIRLVNDGTHYYIDNDTRPKVQNSAVTFYSLNENSTIADGIGGFYKQSSTSTTDARYSGTATVVNTGVIGTDTFLIGTISDEGVIQGVLPEGPADTILNIGRNTGSASFRFYIKFYKYSAGVETLIGTSSLSNVIDTSTISEYVVRTNLSQTSFLPTDRILRKLYATSTGSPTAKVSIEGTSPSFSTISAPATSISHNSLTGIQQAGTGITNGHISDGAQTIFGNKTFNGNQTINGGLILNTTTNAFTPPKLTSTERNALTAISGMVIFNTTTNQLNIYNGTSWVGMIDNIVNQSISGVKTFSSIPVLPASNPTTDNEATRKAYVDLKTTFNTPVVITATASQTVFTVNSYITNRIQIFVNGLLQTKTTDYTETNSTTITMVTGLTAGDEFKYIIL